MPSYQEQVRAQYKYTYRLIAVFNAFQAQARIGGRLQRKLTSFIQSAEGAEMDCGTVETHVVNLSEREEDRYFHDILRNKDIEAVVPLDYKTLLPCLNESHKGGQYHHQTTLTQMQAANTAAFIIISPLAPDIITLIPRWYLDPDSKKALVRQPRYNGPEIPLTQGAAEPLPPNYSPFSMPAAHLDRALISLHEFVCGRTEY